MHPAGAMPELSCRGRHGCNTETNRSSKKTGTQCSAGWISSKRRNPDFIRKNGVGPNFADWLAPDENTNKDLLATAYWALIAQNDVADGTCRGKESDAQRYTELLNNIRSAFQKAYITEDGQVGTGTQTSYVVALYTKMAPETLEPLLVDQAGKRHRSSGAGHLSTGFLGTPFLLFTLADHGRVGRGLSPLAQRDLSFLGIHALERRDHMVGALEWRHRRSRDELLQSLRVRLSGGVGLSLRCRDRHNSRRPGFKEIVIHPHLDARMPSAQGEYESVYGKISSDGMPLPMDLSP